MDLKTMTYLVVGLTFLIYIVIQQRLTRDSKPLSEMLDPFAWDVGRVGGLGLQPEPDTKAVEQTPTSLPKARLT